MNGDELGKTRWRKLSALNRSQTTFLQRDLPSSYLYLFIIEGRTCLFKTLRCGTRAESFAVIGNNAHSRDTYRINCYTRWQSLRINPKDLKDSGSCSQMTQSCKWNALLFRAATLINLALRNYKVQWRSPWPLNCFIITSSKSIWLFSKRKRSPKGVARFTNIKNGTQSISTLPFSTSKSLT